MGIAGLEGVEFALILRSYESVRRCRVRSDPVSCGRQSVTSCWIEDPADFCRKMADDCGAEVYRNSTVGSVLGKSAGKDSYPGVAT